MAKLTSLVRVELDGGQAEQMEKWPNYNSLGHKEPEPEPGAESSASSNWLRI